MRLRTAERPLVGALFALSFALKVAAVAYFNADLAGRLTTPDTRDVYRPIAEGLSVGRGYQLHGDHRDATRVPPVFPLYLAAIYRVFGHDAPDWIPAVLNGFWRAATTVMVYLLGVRFFGVATGRFAGLFHACDPWEAFWSALLVKESVAVFLLVAAISGAVSAADRPSYTRGLLAGALLALASLVRYMTLGLFPCLLVLLVCGWRRGRPLRPQSARLVTAFTLGFLFVLAPWFWRNYRIFGEVVVSTHFAGRYLFVGNGAWVVSSTDGFTRANPTTAEGEFIRGVEQNVPRPAEADRVFLEKALQNLASHPGAIVSLLRAKLVNMWRPTFVEASLRNRLVLGLSYCFVLAFAVGGMVLSLRERERLGMLYVPLAFFFVSHLVFMAEIRHRQYLSPFLDIFAGHAVDRLRRRRDGDRV